MMSAIVSPDAYRYRGGVYTFDPEREPAIWGQTYVDFLEHCTRTTKAALLVGLPGSGKSTWAHKQIGGEVIFDATNLDTATRRPIIALAHQRGCEIRAIYFETRFEICQERNAARPEGRRVPNVQMEAMRDKFRLPNEREGISRIDIVGGRA